MIKLSIYISNEVLLSFTALQTSLLRTLAQSWKKYFNRLLQRHGYFFVAKFKESICKVKEAVELFIYFFDHLA